MDQSSCEQQPFQPLSRIYTIRRALLDGNFFHHGNVCLRRKMKKKIVSSMTFIKKNKLK